jgi:hypothetical protein
MRKSTLGGHIAQILLRNLFEISKTESGGT